MGGHFGGCAAPPCAASGPGPPRGRRSPEGAAPELSRARARSSPRSPGACAVRTARGPGHVGRGCLPLPRRGAGMRVYPLLCPRRAWDVGTLSLRRLRFREGKKFHRGHSGEARRTGFGIQDSEGSAGPTAPGLAFLPVDRWRAGMGALVS